MKTNILDLKWEYLTGVRYAQFNAQITAFGDNWIIVIDYNLNTHSSNLTIADTSPGGCMASSAYTQD